MRSIVVGKKVSGSSVELGSTSEVLASAREGSTSIGASNVVGFTVVRSVGNGVSNVGMSMGSVISKESGDSVNSKVSGDFVVSQNGDSVVSQVSGGSVVSQNPIVVSSAGSVEGDSGHTGSVEIGISVVSIVLSSVVLVLDSSSPPHWASDAPGHEPIEQYSTSRNSPGQSPF